MAASRTRKLRAIANKHKGEFTVTIGGKPRVLKFDHAALEALEGTDGLKSIGDLYVRLSNPGMLSIKQLRALIWAGQLHAKPDLQLGDVKTDGPIMTLVTPVLAALGLGILGVKGGPETAEKKDETPPTPPAAVSPTASPAPTDSPAGSVSPIASSGS